MRALFGLVLVSLIASTTFAGELDGKTFCRTVKSNGGMGQPPGEKKHCVSFADDIMTDNANTFFGNPPESIHYVLVANKILVVRAGNLYADYKVNTDMSKLANNAGAILKIK